MDRQDKILSLLGLARRAGRLEAGFDPVRAAARAGRSALIVAAGDISEKTWKNLRYEAERARIQAVRIDRTMDELGRACGVRAGIVSVNDKGFAGALLKAMEEAGNGSDGISGTNAIDDRSGPVGREKEEETI